MDQPERTRRAEQARPLAADLVRQGIAAVAVTWVDTSGVTRVKAVPTTRLEHAAAWGIGASPVFDTFLLDDSIVSGRFAGGPIGDLRLHPDLSRLVAPDSLPGWAWAPADRYAQDGTPHPRDARTLAIREVARLAEAGLTVRAAFEVEWCVSEGQGDEFVPACSGPAYGMTRLTELSGYLATIVTAMSAVGVSVEQIHPEYAAGQYEVSVGVADPVAAADTFVLVREVIRAVTQNAGMRATFSPKVLAGGVGNGAHVHLSLWRDEANLMADGDGEYGLTGEGEAFTAGILTRLAGLLAVGAPSVASYLRLIPSHWAGAYACWGLENREAALRFVTGADGSRSTAANVEVKCFDAAANPYLVVAALLAAGRAGLADKARLPAPVEVDPESLEPAERQRRGITALPSSLGDAVTAFESETALWEALGEEMADTIVAVRRGEVALFDGASPEEVAALTRWKH
jgi:glutamine synthetase